MDGSMQVCGGIWLGKDARIGDVRISLLEKIEETGSISRAAKAVGISYKTAWDAVDVMNNLSGGPLVETVTGGRGGGGTRLTEAGTKLVQTYRLIQTEHERFLAGIRSGIEDFDNFYAVIRRLSMRSSARNQYYGKVTQILVGTVSAEVRITLGDVDEVAAIISRESLENLDIRIGCEIWVLIKSSSVVLGTKESGIVFNLPNCLHGKVTRLTRGKDSSDVVLELSGGNTLSAMVTNAGLDRLQLREGAQACAMFHASSILIGMPG
ncbi:MAG: TOBE domain-containing protein [Sideroxydans sp.]|nr:TOBE domain-containing protein [Sideroxydans sp.]